MSELKGASFRDILISYLLLLGLAYFVSILPLFEQSRFAIFSFLVGWIVFILGGVWFRLYGGGRFYYFFYLFEGGVLMELWGFIIHQSGLMKAHLTPSSLVIIIGMPVLLIFGWLIGFFGQDS